MPNTGRIHEGCRLEEEFFHAFTKDNRITLVLDKNHADFQVAQDIADLINSQMGKQVSNYAPLAHAFNQGNIVVEIPAQYRDDPVSFVSQVLSLPIMEPRTVPRVVINERTGTIVISGDVEIGSVAVTHKNLVIEAGGQTRRAAVRRRRSGRSDLARDSRPWSRPSMPYMPRPKTSSKSSRAWTATASCTPH